MLKKISSIITKKDKLKFLGLFLMMIVSAFLDLVGISAILPIISLLSSGAASIDGSFYLGILSQVFGTTDVDTLFILSIGFLICLVIIKSIYGLLYTYVTNKFTMNYSRNLTNKLMNTYLSMPYEYHLENNSSKLMRKSLYDVDCFVAAIEGILKICVLGITIIMIVVYLAIISWQVTAIVGVLLAVFACLTVFVLRPKTRKIAKNVQNLNSNNYKYLSQAFNGIKESKISNTEFNFSKIYDSNRDEINHQILKWNVLSSIPGHLIELVGMLGISISLILIKVCLHVDDMKIIEIFTVFVYAVIKLLPAVINSTSIINAFNYYKTSVDTIYEDIQFANENVFEKVSEEDVNPLPFNNSIQVNNISFAYKSMPEKVVLNDVSLEIKKNTSVAISGQSGSGKTTLIDNILALLKPNKGEILVDGVDVNSDIRAWRKNISYIPQNIFLTDDTIRNNVAFGLSPENIDDSAVNLALKMAELDEFVAGLKDGLDTVIGERGVRLSGGQRQRIGIARAFYRNTNIIVFDEATSSLDYETEKHIFEHVSQYSKDHTLIIITHRLNTIESCDKIYQIVDNKITQVK